MRKTPAAPGSRTLRMWLLDVNVLLALAWPEHPHHQRAISWFVEHSQEGIRTCAITQLGFVRISSISATPGMAASIEEATEQLKQLELLEAHAFWNCPVTWTEVWRAHGPFRGHRQITEAYLVALAAAHHGRLVTFDRGLALLPGAQGVVEVLA